MELGGDGSLTLLIGTQTNGQAMPADGAVGESHLRAFALCVCVCVCAYVCVCVCACACVICIVVCVSV